MIVVTNNEGTPGVPVTARLLAEGKPALDAIEAGVRLVESDETIRTVGRGGWPNLLGEVELDGSVMDGTTLRVGAVGALKGYLHPITVARAVMEKLPHVFLAGAGAARAVVLYMKMGMTVDAAVREAAEDMRRLSGGLINRVTIHAIDAKGGHKCVAVNGDASNTYWLWREGETKPQALPAEIITI